MSYQPIPASAGHKVIKGDIAPHLDFGLFDDIEIKVNRNVNFEAMVRMFDERDAIYLTDFARLTKYPNKLHSMARERNWDVVRENDRIVGYSRPKPPVIKAKLQEKQKPKTFARSFKNNKQTISHMVEIDLMTKGEVNIDEYEAQGHSRKALHVAIYRLREKGMVITSYGRIYKLVN